MSVKAALLILTLAGGLSAAPKCILVQSDKDASNVVVTCPGWPPGFTRTLHAPDLKEWNAFTGFDTTRTDTVTH